jgi:prepilin-type N-terminal cleavage/methylation domain-containing protein
MSEKTCKTSIHNRHETAYAVARRSAAFTLVELLVVIAIIGILVALLLPAIQAAREAARRSQCQNNIKNVALAVLNYESAHKTLPNGSTFPTTPAVQSNVNFSKSWAVEILPYIENQALYDAFIFENASGQPVPMRDDLNRDERGTVLPVMLCPTDRYNQTRYEGHGGNWARGNYAANVGAGAMHTGPTTINASGIKPLTGPDSPGWKHHLGRGVMGPNVGSTIAQITDGTSKTMLLSEIRAGVTAADPRGTWAFGHAGGNLVAWHGWGGDANGPNVCGPTSDDIGSTLSLDCASTELTTECMTCHGPGSFDQATSRSAHVGGVFVALCDGSVQFISDDIETSGSWGACCRAWDHLILSQDANDPGGTVRRPQP